MIVLAAVAVLLPFAAAFIGMIFGPTISHLLTPFARRVRRSVPSGTANGRARILARRLPANGPALVAVLPVAASTVLTAVIAVVLWQRSQVRTGTLTLVRTGGIPFGISLDIDRTAAVVALLVCCVALAVQVYSVAYMRDDPRYSSYAAFISLFTSAMLIVVFSGDLLVLYVGWEIMGVCSYFLIGHYWHDRATSRAAVKAFLVTRLGDVGFLFGIFVLGLAAHSFEIRTVLSRVPSMSHTTLVAGTLLLLCGVAGKSAQFPLHTWLPDAMAGPTPVSALIHAATMVAAGIYVVARLYAAFLFAPATLTVLGVIAAISMLGAALAALAQDDLKRVLAYSTISQLAYMGGGLAVGTRGGALFHLLAHGAFKALLFLGAELRHRRGRLQHAERHGRPAARHAGDVLVDDGRLRGPGRCPARERLLQQGHHPRPGVEGGPATRGEERLRMVRLLPTGLGNPCRTGDPALDGLAGPGRRAAHRRRHRRVRHPHLAGRVLRREPVLLRRA